MKNTVRLPDIPAMTLMSCSLAYTRRDGVMKNSDSRTMMKPSGTRNLFLLPGSDIILVRMYSEPSSPGACLT